MRCKIHGDIPTEKTSVIKVVRTHHNKSKNVVKRRCIECHNNSNKKYRNREAKNAWTRMDRARNPEKYRAYEKKLYEERKALFPGRDNLINKCTVYGINEEQYEKLFIDHDNKCAICGNIETKKSRTPGEICKLAVDHCHACEESKGKGLHTIRGLLCSLCNSAIGKFKDDINLLKKAINYLEGHKH